MVFMVFTEAPDNYKPLQERIESRFPEDHYVLGTGKWLIAHSGTAKELYIRLFPEPEFPLSHRNVIVFGVSGYWGMAPQDTWEWVISKSGAKLG